MALAAIPARFAEARMDDEAAFVGCSAIYGMFRARSLRSIAAAVSMLEKIVEIICVGVIF